MRIFLIQPPCWGIMCPPYGIAVLAGFLRANGFDVHVKDLNIELYHECKKEFQREWDPSSHLFWVNRQTVEDFINQHTELIDKKIKEILDEKPDIVGFSIQYSSEHMAREFAGRIREKDDSIKIIFGGPQASRVFSGHELAGLKYVDYVVQGEGELIFKSFLDAIRGKREFKEIPGLFYKDNGDIIDNGDSELIFDLSALPYADFSDFDFSKYKEPFRLPISISRGCVNRCIYCNERPYWRQHRHRKAENVFNEIKYQMGKIGGIDYIDFHDSLINGSVGELEKLCDFLISEGIKVRWGGQAIIRKEMRRDLLLKMKKAGCICLNYGLETASHSMLDKIGKVLSREADIDRIVRDTHEAGIECILNFMFGFPGESEADFSETLDFCRRNRGYIDMVNPSPGFCAFYKGSYGYENPDKLDILLHPENGAIWKSKDGTNTYPVRLERFERFLKEIKSAGIKSYYPYEELLKRNDVLGHYYFEDKNWKKSIDYCGKAIELTPDNETNFVYLSKSYAFINKEKESKRYMEEVVRLRRRRNDPAGAEDFKSEIEGLNNKINKKNTIKGINEAIKRFLSERGVAASQPAGLDARPVEFHMELTHRCNSRCLMCDLWQQGLNPKEKELRLEEIERLVKESDYLKGVETVVLSGGEPFLREDFVDICGIFTKYLPDAGLNILTNGLDTDLILDKVGSLIKRYLPKKIMIGSSIDGVGDIHDRIRGVKGSFNRMKETIEVLRKINGLEYCLNFTITPQNYTQLLPSYEFSKNIGARFSAQFVVKKEVKYDFSWKETELDEIEIMAMDIISDLLQGRSLENVLNNPDSDTGLIVQIYYWSNLVGYERDPKRIMPYCPAGRRFAMFTPYGDLFFCPLLKHKTAGSIRTKSFDELWVSGESSRICDFISSGKCHCWLVCIIAPVMGDILSKR